jgi:hypothetical protein
MTSFRVRWYCGHYYGHPRWIGDTYEPDDCDTTFETLVSKEEWDTESASVVCPKCKQQLWQKDDDPHLVIEEGDELTGTELRNSLITRLYQIVEAASNDKFAYESLAYTVVPELVALLMELLIEYDECRTKLAELREEN